MVDGLKLKNLSTDVVKDILSYNIFSFDKMIQNIVFTFNGEIIDDFLTVSRTDFFGREPSSEAQKEVNEKVEAFKEKIKGMSPEQIRDFIKKEVQKKRANTSTLETTSANHKICVDAGHGGSDPGAVGIYNLSISFNFNDKPLIIKILKPKVFIIYRLKTSIRLE